MVGRVDVTVVVADFFLSFAIWGIGDIFYGSGQNPTVATVGDADELPVVEALQLTVRGRPDVLPVSSAFQHRFRAM